MHTPRHSAQPSATTSSPFTVFHATVRRAPTRGHGRRMAVKTKAAEELAAAEREYAALQERKARAVTQA